MESPFVYFLAWLGDVYVVKPRQSAKVGLAVVAVAAALVGKFVPTAPAPLRAFSTTAVRRMDLLVLGCAVFGAGGMVGRGCNTAHVAAEAERVSAKRSLAAVTEAPKAAAAPVPAAAAEDPEKHLLTDEEKAFLNAAGDYLSTLNTEDAKLAKVMAGAQTGESTLGDIKAAIENARAREGDYSVGSVPAPFAAVDKKIRTCKGLHDSAFDGMLAYWKDSNTSHIKNGTATFEKAGVLENECIHDLTAAMQAVATKRRKANVADAGKR
jgi:hypothetical protein